MVLETLKPAANSLLLLVLIVVIGYVIYVLITHGGFRVVHKPDPELKPLMQGMLMPPMQNTSMQETPMQTSTSQTNESPAESTTENYYDPVSGRRYESFRASSVPYDPRPSWKHF